MHAVISFCSSITTFSKALIILLKSKVKIASIITFKSFIIIWLWIIQSIISKISALKIELKKYPIKSRGPHSLTEIMASIIAKA